MQSLAIPSIILLLLTSSTVGYLVPHPPGKYNVTLTTGTLVDHTRKDPYAASPTPRALMVSVFQPATCDSTVPVPYMPNKTAEYQDIALQETFNITADFTPILREAQLPVCPDEHSSSPHLAHESILIFEPGYSIPRFYYNMLCSALASEGFTVVSIDHPFDANILVYPDGHAVYNNATILDSPTWDEYERAADASFVIDQLGNASAIASLLPVRGPRVFKTDRVAMVGHSVGGASSVVAAKQDHRIRAAVNWDGTIFGSPPLDGLDQPVLFLTHDNTTDPSWLEAWLALKGPKLVSRVANTTHQTFSDIPAILDAAGQSTEQFEGLLGTIAPQEMLSILVAYTTTWVEAAFTPNFGLYVPLMQVLGSAAFPEVKLLLRGNF